MRKLALNIATAALLGVLIWVVFKSTRSPKPSGIQLESQAEVTNDVQFAGLFPVPLLMAASVQPGRPISQYPRVTVLQGTDIIPIARTNVSPATNMGLTGNILSNFVSLVATQNIRIEAGTNVIITTNVSGQQVTFTISVTNTGTGTGADGVWTNNAGVIHPKVSNGQQTNSIQIYTNGAMAVGLGTLPYWGVPVAGETLVSLRDTGVGDLPWNETFVGVRTGANLFWQNNFVEPSVNRRTYAMEQLGLRIDEYMTSDSNFVYRAFNTNGLDIWHFTPSGAGASNDTRYTFNSTGPVDASDPILAIQNSTTNKLTVYGGAGNVNIVGQITNQFLTASKIVLTDAGKGLVSSAFGETDLQGFATTNYVLSKFGSNFINFSVQAAKLTATNFPGFETGFQDWELVFFPTNESGSAFPLPATWQFVVPFDYATNSMQVYMLQTLVSTNGPGTSNTVWRASVLRATPTDSTDVRVGAFSTPVWATNTWAASTSNTNKVQSLTIDLSTSSLLQAGDFAILKIERVNTNDTYRGSTSLVGLQLRYAKP